MCAGTRGLLAPELGSGAVGVSVRAGVRLSVTQRERDLRGKGQREGQQGASPFPRSSRAAPGPPPPLLPPPRGGQKPGAGTPQFPGGRGRRSAVPPPAPSSNPPALMPGAAPGWSAGEAGDGWGGEGTAGAFLG